MRNTLSTRGAAPALNSNTENRIEAPSLAESKKVSVDVMLANRKSNPKQDIAFSFAGKEMQTEKKSTISQPVTGTFVNPSGHPQSMNSSLNPFPVIKEDGAFSMISQSETERLDSARTGMSAKQRETLLKLDRKYQRLEKRFQKERVLSAQRKLHAQGIPSGPPSDPWNQKKHMRQRRPEGMPIKKYILENKKTINEQIYEMDKRMFGKQDIPWKQKWQDSDSEYVTDSSDPSESNQKRLKTPEHLKIIQSWKNDQNLKRRGTITLFNQLHLIKEQDATPKLSENTKKINQKLKISKSLPKLSSKPAKVKKLDTKEAIKEDQVNKILALQAMSYRRESLRKTQSRLSKSISRELHRMSLSTPGHAVVSSGTSSSSDINSREDTLSPKKRASNLANLRRLTSSNIEAATIHGITPTDAQALLEKEQNKEMYRQNLKRRLQDTERESYNLEYKKQHLCKMAVIKELEHQREVERLQREIIDQTPDNYGYRHKVYSDVLQDHAKSNFLEERFIDRGSYPDGKEYMKQLNKPYEYSPKVSRSAMATGQTEKNFSLDGENAEEDFEKQKLDGYMQLSNEDPYQRDQEQRPPPSRMKQDLSTVIASKPVSDKIFGMVRLRMINDYIKNRAAGSWSDYQVRYQFIQLSELLDSSYNLAAQRCRLNLQKMHQYAEEVIKETFANLKLEQDKKVLQQMVEDQLQREQAEFEQSLFWQQQLYNKVYEQMLVTDALDQKHQKLQAKNTELQRNFSAEEPCQQTIKGMIVHEKAKTKELKAKLRSLKKQAMLNPVEATPEQTPREEEKSPPGFKTRLRFLARPKNPEPKQQTCQTEETDEIAYEQEEVIKDMTRAIQQDKKSLLQVKTMHAYQNTCKQELITMLENHLKDLDRGSAISKRLIKDHEQALKQAKMQNQQESQMQAFQRKQAQNELEYLKSKQRMVSLLLNKAFPIKRDTIEEAKQQLTKMPSDRRGQQVEIDITNPEIISLIEGNKKMTDLANFKQDVSNIGSYMGIPEISAIGRVSNQNDDSAFDQNASRLLDTLHEDSETFPDQIKFANKELDHIYRSKSASKAEEVKFKVSMLPSIDKETLVEITKQNISPLNKIYHMPMKPSKSTEKLQLMRFKASRNMEISKSQKILSTKNKTQKFIAPSSPLPQIINNKAQLAASLLSISKKRAKEALQLYDKERKSEKQFEMSMRAQQSSGRNKTDSVHVIPVQAQDLQPESFSDEENYSFCL